MRRADIGAAVFLILLAAYVLSQAAGYPPSPIPGAPGPAFFPRLLGGALLILSLLLIGMALRKGRDKEAPPAIDRRALGRVLLTLLFVVVFLIVVERGDFFLMLPPVLAGVMWLMGERRAGIMVLAPVAFSASVYIVFFRLFGVPFPTLF